MPDECDDEGELDANNVSCFSSGTECVAKARSEAGDRQHLLQAGQLWPHLILRLHLPVDSSVE